VFHILNRKALQDPKAIILKMGNILLVMTRLLIMATTDAAMIPALMVMKRNRRHFECFIGCFHLFVSLMFNTSAALEVNMFLSEDEWHFISDVLSISYFLVLLVHLMGIEDENVNIILRYMAFSLTWIAKAKDKWDSILWEAVLITTSVAGLMYRQLTSYDIPVDPGHASKAGLALGSLSFTYLLSGLSLFENDVFHIIYALYHLSGGAFFYHAWLSIPCRDAKKDDDYHLPSHNKQSAYI